MLIKKEIIICEKCKGTGKSYSSMPHGETDTITCEMCKGTGVMLRKTTLEPYSHTLKEEDL
jgi:DnaJ-class molecular chaperone